MELSTEDMEELVYYSRNAKDRELEMQFWSRLADEVRQRFLAKSGLDVAKYSIDWSRVFEEHKIYATRIPDPPKAKVEVVPQEKKEV